MSTCLQVFTGLRIVISAPTSILLQILALSVPPPFPVNLLFPPLLLSANIHVAPVLLLLPQNLLLALFPREDRLPRPALVAATENA